MTTNIPEAGDIYTARIDYHLADGTWTSEHLPVLLYDVRQLPEPDDWQPEAGQPLRILWARAIHDDGRWGPGQAGSSGVTAYWHVVTTSGLDMAREAARLGVPVTTTAIRIALLEHVGVYQPRDPKHNSVEIMRDAAIAQATAAMTSDAEVAEATAQLRAVEAERAAAETARDAAIRGALSRGVRAAQIARQTGLSLPRIYQIRDGRR